MNSAQKRSFFTKTTHQEKDSFKQTTEDGRYIWLHSSLHNFTNVHDARSIKHNALFIIALFKPSYIKW